MRLIYLTAISTSHHCRTDGSAIPEHHAAVLPVEGEVVDFDATGASVDGRGQPDHATVWIYQSVSVKRHLKTPIHTLHIVHTQKKGVSYWMD